MTEVTTPAEACLVVFLLVLSFLIARLMPLPEGEEKEGEAGGPTPAEPKPDEMSKPTLTRTLDPYTDIDLANARILTLESFIHNEASHRATLIKSTNSSIEWHKTEIARYRKIASDATDRLFQQHREFVLHKHAVDQIANVLLANSPATNPIDPGMMDAAKNSLSHEASLENEARLDKVRAAAMDDMVEYMQFSCSDAGLPVEQ